MLLKSGNQFLWLEKKHYCYRIQSGQLRQVQAHLGDKLQIAIKLVKYLNSRSKEQLRKASVQDRTMVFMEANKVIMKRNFIQ